MEAHQEISFLSQMYYKYMREDSSPEDCFNRFGGNYDSLEECNLPGMYQLNLNIDNLSGINYEWLNVLVFNFFPFSGGKEDDSVIPTEILAVGRYLTLTGSFAERLELPLLVEKDTLKQKASDIDMMVCYNSNQVLHHTQKGPLVLVAEQERTYPLHCKVGIYDTNLSVLGYVDGQTFMDQCYQENVIQKKRDLATASGVDIQVLTSKIESAYLDVVPCLSVICPEDIIQNFFQRVQVNTGSIPFLEDVPGSLQKDGIHVVYKPHKSCLYPETQFRLSFSVIERELGLSLNDTQRTVYRVLKALVKNEINDKAVTDDDKLPSYMLKTSLFWVCEELSTDYCVPSNSGIIFLLLLDKLIHFLSDGCISHFFIPEGNLLDGYNVDKVKYWMKALIKIRKNPVDSFVAFWKSYDLKERDVTDLLLKIVTSFQPSVSDGNLLNAIKEMCCDSSRSRENEKTESSDEMKSCALFETMLSLHARYVNITDILRLIVAFDTVFCFCEHKFIRDFSDRCPKCLTAAFCMMTEHAQEYFYPYLLPEAANMWYILSLDIHDEGSQDECKKNITEMFEMAKNNTIQLYYTNTHYALYLIANRKYVEAVAAIIQVLTKYEERSRLIFDRIKISCCLIEMLDKILQVKLSGNSFLSFRPQTLLYHLLLSCYIQAGIFAEVIWDINDIRTYGYDPRYEEPMKESELVLRGMNRMGDQFFLKEDYHQALQCYTLFPNYLVGNRLFNACIASMFNEECMSKSLQRWIEIKKRKIKYSRIQ